MLRIFREKTLSPGVFVSFIFFSAVPINSALSQSDKNQRAVLPHPKSISAVQKIAAAVETGRYQQAVHHIDRAAETELANQPSTVQYLRAQWLWKSKQDAQAALKILEEPEQKVDRNQAMPSALGAYIDVFRAELLEKAGQVKSSFDLRERLVQEAFPPATRKRGRRRLSDATQSPRQLIEQMSTQTGITRLPTQVGAQVLLELMQSVQPPVDENSKELKQEFRRQAKRAMKLFQSTSRRLRGLSVLPDLSIEQLRLSLLTGSAVDCKLTKKLHARYPAHPRLSEWGPLTTRNRLYGKRLACPTTLSDVQSRLRQLGLAGQHDRIGEEIALLRTQGLFDPWSTSSLELQTLLMRSGSNAMNRVEDILKQFETSQGRRPQYWAYRAKFESRVGRTSDAARSFQKAYKLDPRGRHALDYLMSAGFSFYQVGQADEANSAFTRIEKIRPRSRQARDARWYRAWAAMQAEKWKDADRIFETELKTRRKSDQLAQSRALYWRAVIAHRLGEFDRARNLWRELVTDPSIGYYSVLAWYRFRELGNLSPEDKEISLGVSSSMRELAAAKSPIEESPQTMLSTEDTAEASETDVMDPPVEVEPGVDSETDSEQVTAEVSPPEEDEVLTANDALAVQLIYRIELLNALGLSDEASHELTRLERTAGLLKKGIDGKKWLIGELERLGRADRSSRLAELDLGGLRLKKGVIGAPDIWRASFPLAFKPDVIASAKQFNVPRELAWSIMRAESHYRPDARSPVGAVGLMQVMPFTGERVATELLNLENWVPERLAEPATNIKIGVRYLNRLMEKFDSKLPLVAAAYNAGPHRVSAWLKAFGTLHTDAFVEQIPFLETRNYVKKVIRNYKLYKLLYEKDRESMKWVIQPVGAAPLEGNEALVNW